MATRFYPLTNFYGQPYALNPGFDGGWEQTTDAIRRWMVNGTAPTFPWFEDERAREEPLSAETSASGSFDVLLAQFISRPLSGAQTISGTIKGQLLAAENNSDANMRAQMMGKVVSNDGTTVTGTLFALDGSALSSEFALINEANRKFPLAAISPVTVTNVNAADGDRIVLEVGYRAHNTGTSSREANLRLTPHATSDLAENETATAGKGWFEFSMDMTFDDADNERRFTAVLAEVATRIDRNMRASDVLLEIAARTDRSARFTEMLLEVASEEYWYGWGVNLEEE